MFDARDQEKALREFEVALKAVNNIVRMRILRSVSKEAKSVGQIAEELGLSPASASAHINLLWRAGFLHRQKRGNQVFYRLNREFVLQMQAFVREYLEITQEG